MSINAQLPGVLNNAPLPVLIFAGVLFVILLAIALLFARYFSLWLQSFLANAKISLLNLMMMSLRKTDPRIIVKSKIMAVQAGIADDQNITTDDLETHYLAGGHVPEVIETLIAASRNGTALTFQEAAALDLAGKNVIEAARSGMIIGQIVAADTVIHPAGSILIEGKPMDAVSVDGSIDAGQRVEILEVHEDVARVRLHVEG